MIRALRVALGGTIVAVALPLVGWGGSATAASSTAGACTTDQGVTVVVDFSALGGDIVERCVPGPLSSSYTGWDALTDAGFKPQAAVRFPGFVCRLSAEPSAAQSLSIPGNPDYHEQCVNTPPSSAFWGYWYATNGGSWTYSSVGASNRVVSDGGYEGWAFALDTAGHPPVPGVAPHHRVATQPTAPTTKPAGAGSHHGSSGASSGGQAGATSGAEPTTAPTTATTSPGSRHHRSGQHAKARRSDATAAQHTADAPTAPSTTTSPSGVQVTGAVPDAADSSSSGNPAPTVLVIGVLVVLGAGAGLTAWRRRARRG